MSRYRIVQKGQPENRVSILPLIEFIISILTRDNFIGITIEQRNPAVVVTIVREKG